jgi:HK97 family phage portal protein
MGFFDFWRSPSPAATPSQAPGIRSEGVEVLTLDDPRLRDFLALGLVSGTGISISPEKALTNPTVFRCVSLVSRTMGMLPLHLRNRETKEKETDHPLFRVLHRKPNPYQSAFSFRELMQMRMLVKGNAYAFKTFRAGAPRASERKVTGLFPLNPDFMEVALNPDWTLRYEYRPPDGARKTYGSDEIFHLRGTPDMAKNGIIGTSMVTTAAREAIGIAIAQDHAIARLFKNGSFISGVLETDRELDPAAAKRMGAEWAELHSGTGNAGKTAVLEQGLKYKAVAGNARDAQTMELRRQQIEEIARVFGVPRPLLGMDDTSWGSGIDVLGQMFVRFALSPWFDEWQQAIQNTLLSETDSATMEARFNAGVLERGNMAAQADYLAKALGSGGQQPWMTQNEARELLDMPKIKGAGDTLNNPAIGHNGGPPLENGK